MVGRLGEASQSLSQRTVRAGIWATCLNLTTKSLQLVRIVILARLLAPFDFGLLGIALLTMAALETFSKTGFKAALIQRKEDTSGYLDTAWMVSLLRGFTLFAVLFFTAPFVAGFFENPSAVSILQVIAFSLLFRGLTNVGVVYFLKELDFRKQFIYQLSGTVADFLVAVTLAFLLRNVWALVWALLAGEVVRFAVSYLIHPYRPRLSFSLARAKDLFAFGRWILGSGVIIFLLIHGDDAFVGKVLGAAALGFYQMAYRLSNVPATEITHVISQVTFPAYSKLQDDLLKLREAYRRVLQMTASIAVPLAGGIFILTPEFTRMFMGEKWIPMVPAMRVLCLFGVTRSINATMGPLFEGLGRPEVVTKGAAFQLGVLAVIIYPLTIKWGILGTSLAVIVPNLLVLFYLVNRVVRMVHLGLMDLVRLLLFPVAGTILMILSIAFAKPFFSHYRMAGFVLLAIMGAVVNFAVMYLLDEVSGYGLRANVKSALRTIRTAGPKSYEV